MQRSWNRPSALILLMGVLSTAVYSEDQVVPQPAEPAADSTTDTRRRMDPAPAATPVPSAPETVVESAPEAPPAAPSPTPTPQVIMPKPAKTTIPFVTFAGGMGITQANWSSQGIGGSVNEFLEYDMDTNMFTRLEGSLCIPKLGLTFGTNINMDNNAVAESNKYAGYIGIKRLNMRVQSGKLSGTAKWTGPGTPRNVEFDEKITHIDLLYWFPRMLGIGGFVGMGYSKFAIPTEIKTYISQGSEDHYHAGSSFFDPDFKMKMYDLIFGFDTFSGEVMYGSGGALNVRSKRGFGILFATEDRFGIGKNEISDAALAESVTLPLNTGKRVVGDNKTYFLVQNDTSLGIKWSKKTETSEIAIGLGYEVSFIFGDGFNKGNSTPEELLCQPQNSLLRHGPTARFFARF